MPFWLATMKPSTVIHAVMGLALVLALGWGARVNHLRGVARAETVQLQKDFDAFKIDVQAKSIIATAKQLQVNQAKEKEYVAKAEVADQRYADLRSQYAAAVMRGKAAANRDRSGPAAAAEGGSAGVPEAEAAAPELCISDADAAVIGDLAAYAMAAHEWAVSIDETPSESSGNK